MTNFRPKGVESPLQSDDTWSPNFELRMVIVALRCWWKVATPIGIALAIAACAAVVYLREPRYTASTWILIRERPEVLLTPAEHDNPRKYVQNQVELMRSPTVLEPVAANPAMRDVPELTGERDLVQALRRQLKVRELGQSDYFVVEFTSTDAAKSAFVVNTVAQSYVQLQRSLENTRSDRTLTLLEQQLINQQSIVKTYRDKLRSLSLQLTGKDVFGTSSSEKGIQVQINNPLAELNSKLVAAEVERTILQAQLQAETELLSTESFEPSPMDVDRQVEADPQIVALRARLTDAREQLREHERSSVDLAKNAPYQHLRKQVKNDENSLEQQLVELRKQTRADLERAARAAKGATIAEMERQVAAFDLTLQLLQERLTGELTTRKQYTGETLELEFLRSDYERATNVLNAISDRLVRMRLEQRTPYRVDIFREAVAPVIPDEVVSFKRLGVTALAAFLFPFALAAGIEHLYRRVSSRSQLETEGRIEVVGEIAALPRGIKSHRRRNANEPDVELQLFEESIDGLRNYLTLVESLDGLKVLAVTSAVSQEGKSSLAAQLALSLATATGEKTLVVDGDMRSPDIHRIFELACSPGLVDVLKGDCPAEEAIQTCSNQALDVLAAGELSSSPHRLLGKDEFAGVIARLRDLYRYIIIDTPPLLPASETLVIARAADAAVLCARRDYSRVEQVMDAYLRLQAAGVKTAGAVLNGIPTRHYAYKYGSYYYNSSRFRKGSEAPSLGTSS